MKNKINKKTTKKPLFSAAPCSANENPENDSESISRDRYRNCDNEEINNNDDKRFMRNSFALQLQKALQPILRQLSCNSTNHKYELKHRTRETSSLFPCDEKTEQELREQINNLLAKYPPVHVEFVALP